MFILITVSSFIATVLYSVLAPFVIAHVIDHILNIDNKTWGPLATLVMTYFGVLIAGDVIAWRLVDFYQWTIEDQVSRSSNKYTRAFITLSDTTIYQIIPLATSILGSCILIFMNGSAVLALFILVSASSFILLTPVLTKKLSIAEIRYNTELSFSKLNKIHTIQQTIIKMLLTLFSVAVLYITTMQITDTKISLGIGIMSLIYGTSLSRQLFTFSNNSIKNYRTCLSSIKLIR